jgi:protocatechuate 3,4-dioxygenase alpha subunit
VTGARVTSGQTIGPFFGTALPYEGGANLVPSTHPRVLRLHGWVLDGAGEPVPDALLEIWQTGPDGHPVQQPGSLHRDGWTFTGWGRSATDNAGHYSFNTLKPGAEPGQAPFFAMTIFARGLLDRLFTRVYLPGDDSVLAADALLSAVASERRSTLIAETEDHSAGGGSSLRFDVVLQGDRETVFLDYSRRGEDQ